MSALRYAIIGTDAPGATDRRKTLRPKHLDHLRSLQDTGQLIAAGPRPAVDSVDPGSAGVVGSIIIASFDNIDDARAWADADPYAIGGVFDRVEVLPFVQVFPE